MDRVLCLQSRFAHQIGSNRRGLAAAFDDRVGIDGDVAAIPGDCARQGNQGRMLGDGAVAEQRAKRISRSRTNRSSGLQNESASIFP